MLANYTPRIKVLLCPPSPQKRFSQEKNYKLEKNICNSPHRPRANSNMYINGLILYVLFYWFFLGGESIFFQSA